MTTIISNRQGGGTLTTVLTPTEGDTDIEIPRAVDEFMGKLAVCVRTELSLDGTCWATRNYGTTKEIRWDQVALIKAFIAGWRAAREIS